MRYVDLFCGMGSFSYSFRKLGFRCVFACDICAVARANYEHNFGLRPEGDVERVVSLPAHDVLCAGFPCQPFSHAGRHGGFEDARGTLFFHVMRLVEASRPTYVVLENVPALKTHDGGRTFAVVCDCLRRAGYRVAHAVLTASDYGLPQRRKRLLVLATRDDGETCDDATQDDETRDKGEGDLDFSAHRARVTLSDFFGRAFDRDFAYTIRCGGRASGIGDRHNWDAYRVDGEIHHLTLDEAKRLQGFGDDYVLVGPATRQWKVLGNTIPTVFTHLIGLRLATGVS